MGPMMKGKSGGLFLRKYLSYFFFANPVLLTDIDTKTLYYRRALTGP
jgi:hypothetical protein